MGCDIHLVIEYEKYDWGFVDAFTEGEVHIARDYDLVSAIAFGDGGITDDLPYPPRGIPTNCSYNVKNLFFTTAGEFKQFLIETGQAEEVYKPEEIAKSWGDWALKEYLERGSLPAAEVHTPSWLNLRELKEALGHAGLEITKQSPEFQAVIAAMQVLADHYGPEKVRIVFWFDG